MRTLPELSPSNEDLAARCSRVACRVLKSFCGGSKSRCCISCGALGRNTTPKTFLQETFLRAYSRLSHFRPQWRFSTWSFTIARRTSINYHRRASPATNHDMLLRVVSPAAGPEQDAIAAENRQYLWSVAARILGAEEQAALWLHYVEAMPVGEIAAVLDRSTVAVKTMMFRARKKLLPLVGQLEPEGRSARPLRAAEVLHG